MKATPTETLRDVRHISNRASTAPHSCLPRNQEWNCPVLAIPSGCSGEKECGPRPVSRRPECSLGQKSPDLAGRRQVAQFRTVVCGPRRGASIGAHGGVVPRWQIQPPSRELLTGCSQTTGRPTGWGVIT